MSAGDTLNILQYNVRKSKDTVMATLLRDTRVAEWDVIAIQEPWRNPYTSTTHHPAKHLFHLCYGFGSQDEPVRTCFFINKRLDHTKWQFKHHTRDASSLIVKVDLGIQGHEGSEIAIHNVYNPTQTATNRTSALPLLHRLLVKYRDSEQIVLGDFNLHHPQWGGPLSRDPEAEAEQLVDLGERFGLTITTTPGTVTYRENTARTTIDLCWITQGLIDRLIKSGTRKELDHDSDHLPIGTQLDLRVETTKPRWTRNWRKLDEKRFCKALERNLPAMARPRTKKALDDYTRAIVDALQATADEVLPYVKQSPWAREGWNDTCKTALAETKRLRRVHSQIQNEQTWEAYRAARNHKTRTIRKALKQAHRDRVEAASASPQALWKLTKWARTRDKQPPSITPALTHPITKQQVPDPAEKAKLFREIFFPVPPEADLSDIATTEYPEGIPLPPITKKEVVDAINAAASYKAPGPDGLPNRALQVAAPLLADHLTRLFNQSLHLNYWPTSFRESVTVVLRKPDKDDYTVPKAYRPIALLNTLSKVMEAVIAKRLSYLVETHNILPQKHIGGRRLRSTEDALHTIVEAIYKAWSTKPKLVASLLLLDVSGAFDNVSHRRLLHNLRKRKVNEQMVKWIASFLSNSSTRIAMDGFTSDKYAIETGIKQGSPLSPILYIFYNADLIDTCGVEANTTSVGFIDDVGILASGDTTETTCDMLGRALERAQQWANKHASVFAPEKFQLVHFTRARTRIDTTRPVRTSWGDIKPKETCKYLGLTLDSTLQWKAHIDSVKDKVTKTINAMEAIGGSTWGTSLADMRKIYRGVALPQIMYGCSLWSNSGWGANPYTIRTRDIVQGLQTRAARIICGAYRATSRTALDIEAYLLPMKEQIWKHNMETLARMRCSANIPELRAAVHDVTIWRTGQPAASPLRTTRRQLTINSEHAPERITAYVMPPWQAGPDIHIETSADRAKARHDKNARRPGTMSIYTDGSGINGHVGAAAVYLDKGQIRSMYMGTNTTSTVYAAELQGIHLALSIANTYMRENNDGQTVNIYTDNQAAIRSLVRPEGRSGAYILRRIAPHIQKLRDNGYMVNVGARTHWNSG